MNQSFEATTLNSAIFRTISCIKDSVIFLREMGPLASLKRPTWHCGWLSSFHHLVSAGTLSGGHPESQIGPPNAKDPAHLWLQQPPLSMRLLLLLSPSLDCSQCQHRPYPLWPSLGHCLPLSQASEFHLQIFQHIG